MSQEKKDIKYILEDLADAWEGSQSIEEKLIMLSSLRSSNNEANSMIDPFLLKTIQWMKKNLQKAKGEIEKLKELLEKLTAPPFHLAAFIAFFDDAVRSEALVHHGGTRRIVSIDSRIHKDSLVPGDEVYLGPELNTIVRKSDKGSLKCGEIASFEAYVSDDRILIQYKDEKYIVDTAQKLRHTRLKPGDMVHFDRTVQMAMEKIEDSGKKEFFIEDIPDVRVEDVGGQDKTIEELHDLVVARIEDPTGVEDYDLGGSSCVMLCGPPGTGKTLIAKFLASTVFGLTGSKGCFAVVKPGAWESPWVGETQANIRNTFRRLSEAAEQGTVILFLDEVESIGRIRGGMSSHHSDKFLAALLTELDGFVSLGRVIVISASNRKDLIEPALLERLAADGEFHIDRPDVHGARSIFGIHLKATLPYCADGSSPEETRQEIIETAVSRMYSPNGLSNQLCILRFRDGRTRTIEARELISGRLIKQICTAARREALRRRRRGGDPGLCVLDMEKALTKALDRLRERTLTPGNAREHIHDLPQDIDIVSVEPVRPKGVAHEQRYMVLDMAYCEK